MKKGKVLKLIRQKDETKLQIRDKWIILEIWNAQKICDKKERKRKE